MGFFTHVKARANRFIQQAPQYISQARRAATTAVRHIGTGQKALGLITKEVNASPLFNENIKRGLSSFDSDARIGVQKLKDLHKNTDSLVGRVTEGLLQQTRGEGGGG